MIFAFRFLCNRHLNHGRGVSANLTIHSPLMVDGKLRVAFLASRDIESGEELVFDYGVDLEGLLGGKEKKEKKKKKKKKKASAGKQVFACNFC